MLQNGRVSFGQAAFFGLGGYIFGVVVARKLLSPELALIAALVAPSLVAFLLGLVIARITGVAHAMLTLAVGQAFYEVVFRWRELAKGDDGMSFDLPRELFGLSARKPAGPGGDGGDRLDHAGAGAARHHALCAQPHRAGRRRDPRQRGAGALPRLLDHNAARGGLCHRRAAGGGRGRDAGDL